MATNFSPICDNCKGTKFTGNDGFYYCDECGAQTQQLQEIIVEEDYEEGKFVKKLKIKNNTTNQTPELTTWECFNYYLKGLVDELINLGAKEELKLTTLQLWSTYLRKNEIAFFNTHCSQLPKLGPGYHERDANILYNHEIMAKVLKEKKKSTEKSQITPGRGAFKRQKTRLAKSEYEEYSISVAASQSFQSSANRSRLSSTTTGTTLGRSARLSFNLLARKHYKKQMSTKHLEKHENDDKKELLCHMLHGQKSKIKRRLRELQLNRKTIYTILYIALNLIEDDIQLSDMLRFLHEGHLSVNKIRHFFPENIAEQCEKMTNAHSLSSKRNIFIDIQIRQHVINLSKFMHISELKIPNLKKLVKRYCKDLALPDSIALYADRLMNLTMPEMKFRFELQKNPYYEARAMAYIIFMLKLLFGLDDNKEILISESAKLINQKFKEHQINGKEEFQQLFVWLDWVKYIEMRKLILAQCHLTSSNKLKYYVNHDHYIDQIINENKVTDEDVIKHKRTSLINMKRIFEEFLIDQKPTTPLIDFRPTLTPENDYLTAILNDPPNNVYIPEFLNTNHSIRDIHSFVNPKLVKTYFKEKSIKINCEQIDCKTKRNYFKIFRKVIGKGPNNRIRLRKIDFDIGESEWLEEIEKKNMQYRNEEFLIQCKKPVKKSKIANCKEKNENFNRSSIENGLQSNDGNLLKPRSNLDKNDIFDGISDDDNALTDDDNNTTNDDNDEKKLKFYVSSFDYWMFFGKIQTTDDVEFSEIKSKFPNNFNWLLETFAQYLNIDEKYLFEELLILENHFIYMLEDMNKIKDILIFKPKHDDADLARVIEHYKQKW